MNKQDEKLYKKLLISHHKLTHQIFLNHQSFMKKVRDKNQQTDSKAEMKKLREITKKQKDFKKQMNEILKRNNMKQIPKDVYADMRKEMNKSMTDY